jgi:hypothetical protein
MSKLLNRVFTTSVEGATLVMSVDVKLAPHAKHTASRTKLA